MLGLGPIGGRAIGALPPSAADTTPIDPTTLQHEGLWITSFTGSPWEGTASTGGGSAANDLTEATDPPATGTAVDTFTPALFDGVDDKLNADGVLVDYYNAGSYSGWAVIKIPTITTNNPTSYENDAVFSTIGNAYAGVSLRDDGAGLVTVSVWHLDGVGYKEVETLFATNTWLYVQWSYDETVAGGTLWIRVNNASPATLTGVGQIASMADAIRFFQNYDLNRTQGQKLASGLTPVAFTQAQFDGIGAWLQERYPSLDFGFEVGEAEIPFFFGVFPTSVPRFDGRVARLPLLSRNVAPVAAPLTPLPSVEHPDALLRVHAQRPGGITTSAKPERARPLVGREIYPDAIVRREVHASAQQPTALDPEPDDRKVQFTDTIAPHAIGRRWLPAAAQLAFAAQASPDVRRTQFVDAVAPATIDRLRLSTGGHPFATSIPSFPDARKTQFVEASSPSAIDRPKFPTAAQLATGLQAFPDARRTPWVAVSAPDAIDRRTIPAGGHPFSTSIPSFPDSRTQQFVGTIAPVSIPRPFLAPLAAVSFLQLVTAAPSLTFADGYGLAVVFRTPSFATFAPFDGVVPVRPEQAAARDAEGLFPDAIDRRALRTGAQLAFVGSSKPEQPVAFARAEGPSEIRRGVVHPSVLAFVAAPSPRPEHRIALDGRTVYPDAIARRSLLAGQQHTVARAPDPERTIAFVGGDATYVASVDRRVLPTATRQATFWHPFPDARSVPMVDVATAQARPPGGGIGHLLFAASGPVATPSPAPSTPTFYGAVMPSRLTHPRATPAGYVAPPTHERLFAPAFFAAIVPARLSLRFATQSAGQTSPVQLIITPFGHPAYPHTVERERFATAQQLAATQLSPQPERSAPIAWTYTPDVISRGTRAALGHEAGANLDLVIVPAPDLLAPVTPDFARGPAFDLNAHRMFVTAMWPNVFNPGVARVHTRLHPLTVVWTEQRPLVEVVTRRRPLATIVSEQRPLTTISTATRPFTRITTTHEAGMKLHVGASETIRSTFKVFNEATSAWVLTDPSTLSLIVTDPDGVETTYVYGADEEIERLDVGTFVGEIDCTKPGHWRYRWVSTGAAKGADRGYFDVEP